MSIHELYVFVCLAATVWVGCSIARALAGRHAVRIALFLTFMSFLLTLAYVIAVAYRWFHWFFTRVNPTDVMQSYSL